MAEILVVAAAAAVGAAAVGDVEEAVACFAVVVPEAEDVVVVYLFEEIQVAIHIDSQVAKASDAALARCYHPKEAAVAAVVVGSLVAGVSPLSGD